MACTVDGCPVAVEHSDVKTIAGQVGVRLEGEEGYPWHCDQRMEVRSGILGPDFAECKACGLLLLDAASPHINGGIVLPIEFLDGTAMWFAKRPGEAP